MRGPEARREASSLSQRLVLALSTVVSDIRRPRTAVRVMMFVVIVVFVVTTRQKKERGETLSPDSLLGSRGSKHVEWSPFPPL
jgi:hypothetical protein